MGSEWHNDGFPVGLPVRVLCTMMVFLLGVLYTSMECLLAVLYKMMVCVLGVLCKMMVCLLGVLCKIMGCLLGVLCKIMECLLGVLDTLVVFLLGVLHKVMEFLLGVMYTMMVRPLRNNCVPLGCPLQNVDLVASTCRSPGVPKQGKVCTAEGQARCGPILSQLVLQRAAFQLAATRG